MSLKVAGVRLAAGSAGIKPKAAPDLALVELAAGSTTAGIFTRNAFCAAPVRLAREHLQAAAPRYFLVNSGNANAGTGAPGREDALRGCRELAALGGVQPQEVLPFSTGVIGRRLPMDAICAALPGLLAGLDEESWPAAAEALMTTDTRPKYAARTLRCGGATYSLVGMTKGAGMIRPDMATMLAYIATDAAVSQTLLNAMLRQAAEGSFHRINVDGDTSTNDACMLVATGRAGNTPLQSHQDALFAPLSKALDSLCLELAQEIVRDAEGAGKFITLEVRGGRDVGECLQVAHTVAESALVKTAFAGSDPNWGRILAAVGRSALPDLSMDKVSLWFNKTRVVRAGALATEYREEQGVAALSPKEFRVVLDLARGPATTTLWTTDLSHDYVHINADYRS